MKELLGLKQVEEEKIKILLEQILEKKRGKLEQLRIDNPEYDEELAKVGKEE